MDREYPVPSTIVIYANDHSQQLLNKHFHSMDKEDPLPSTIVIYQIDHS
jgi:hypothetical protein